MQGAVDSQGLFGHRDEHWGLLWVIIARGIVHACLDLLGLALGSEVGPVFFHGAGADTVVELGTVGAVIGAAEA